MSGADTRPRPPRDARHAWARLRRAGAPRPSRSNLLAMVLGVVLGFAIIAQVRQTSVEGLENLREDELVRIFADVDQDGDRLSSEIRDLQTSLELLESRTTGEEEAQRAARDRLEALSILAGTAPAAGPGIILRIDDPQKQLDGTALLDAVEELRGAGAEAIQVGDVRVVATTWFGGSDGALTVSGAEVRPPYVITAIGDANTLAGAMQIPGGVTASVRRVGAEAEVQIRTRVVVDALLTVKAPQYARPVPTNP
ncbi:DUF881 domain-containing protein [Phycicoccus sp. CSK15P-2]|uniref:DUF881 domain-containing protein n=1 Tax=Phycicoccus sp. CSK15P-2 TaxID=2807627 RepID=UPI00194E72DC|nr:DUF881 domain-containing protein [Phycicoccus sp. CSK15P-2]MBM6405756.1 DUF881 domain-containing protein [Phycicoccus sp. CSK15P-2]